MATDHTGWKLLTNADIAGLNIIDSVGGGLVDTVDLSAFATGGSLDHTKLLNIGTLTHATIDSYLNQAVKTTSTPTFAALTLTRADPELRLTDTGNNLCARLVKTDTTNYAYQYNQTLPVEVPGKALTFNPGYVTLGALGGSTLVAIEVWAKSTSATIQDEPIFSTIDSDSGDRVILGQTASYNYPAIESDYWLGVGSDSSLKGDNLWHHIVAQWEGDYMRIYVDGVRQAGTNNYNVFTETSNYSAYLGTDSNGNMLNGSVDEVRIYNRKLTQEEITFNYNAGVGKYTPFSTSGLIAWYHLDEGTGSTTEDSSGNGYTGTLVSSPTWSDGKVFRETVESAVWSSRDGILTGEYAIITFGNENSRTILDGKTLRFNIGGVEKGQFDASGNLLIGTTSGIRKLEVNEASGNVFRGIYNDSDGSPTYYFDLLINSTGKMTQNAVGGIGWQFNGTEQIALLDGILQPTTTNDIDLGTSSLLYKDIWEIGKHYFRDSAIYINSNDDGHLDLTADTSIDLNAPVILKAGTATAGTAPLKFTSGVLLTTPEAGAMEFYDGRWYITSTAKQRVIDRTGGVIVATTTVANTTDETTLWTEALSANAMKVGRIYKLFCCGIADNKTALDDITFNLYFGGTLVGTYSPAMGSLSAGTHWHANMSITIRTIGSSGTCAIDTDIEIGRFSESSCSLQSIDTTAADSVTLKVQWDNADAANTISIYQGWLEIKN
jgi:hypothetical protein